MRPCWCCAVGGLLAIVALSAGEPVSQQTGTAAAQSSAREGQPGAGKPLSFDGCIQTAPAAQASAGVKYVLASRSAARGTGADAAGRGRGGNAAGRGADAAGAAPALIRYPLDGDEKTIAPHLNHVVEVVGTLQGTPPPPTAPAGPGAVAIGQTLKVESVKMVAAICP
ncbi:MAG TPA: hypothetical protein VFV95_17965 [Vicinamibacterales bacterium]|nr:hypothetical protein [Vicinamibacterales bacterium]